MALKPIVTRYGDPETPYGPALSDVDGSLVPRDGERFVHATTGGVFLWFWDWPDRKMRLSWSYDKVEILFTTQRVDYILRDYDKGAQYVAPGGTGLILTAISKKRAKTRTAGSAAAAQLGYRHPVRVFAEDVKSKLGRRTPIVVLAAQNDDQYYRLSFELPRAEIAQITAPIVSAIATHRLATETNIPDRLRPGLEQQASARSTGSETFFDLPWWSDAQDNLRPDDFHVYRLPMTPAFTDESGPHELTVALAFDPPVRHRRFDYLAYRMEFVVVRGIDLAHVYELAGTEADATADGTLGDHEVPMRPTRTDRGRGANQVGRLMLTQKPRSQWSDDWYIVVRSINRWMDTEADAQRYALAVSVGAERSSALFDELELELQGEIEVELGT